jgi:hypothetical protein
MIFNATARGAEAVHEVSGMGEKKLVSLHPIPCKVFLSIFDWIRGSLAGSPRDEPVEEPAVLAPLGRDLLAP